MRRRSLQVTAARSLDPAAVGARLRRARTAAGLSQVSLAEGFCSASHISLIESGRRLPGAALLESLAARLGIGVDILARGRNGPAEARVGVELERVSELLEKGRAAAARDRLLLLDLASVGGDVRARALFALAEAHERVGDIEESIEVLVAVAAEARSVDRLNDVAVATMLLVTSYIEVGDPVRAVSVGEQMLIELEERGRTGSDEHLRLGSALLWAYLQRGDVLYASSRASDLMHLATEHGSARGLGSVCWNAALVAAERDDHVLAEHYTQRAIALLSEAGANRDLHRLRLNYAYLLLCADPPDPSSALLQLAAAEPGVQARGSSYEQAIIEVERSRALVALGELEQAERSAHAALGRLAGQVRLESAFAQIALGDALFARGERDGAADAYRAAADMLGMMSVSRQSAAVWRDLGSRLLGMGDAEGAADAFDRALREVGLRQTSPPAPLGRSILLGPVRGPDGHHSC